MARLFVAIGLAPSVVEELARIQPPPARGVRLAPPGQIHLTLHFIGETDHHQAERLATALATVKADPFSLDLEGVGQFPSAAGTTTLWAGIRENPALLDLHGVIARVLVEEGLRPEARPYQPHITLARCAPDVAPNLVQDFLAIHSGWQLADVLVMTFGLFSSTLRGEVPNYRCEREFRL